MFGAKHRLPVSLAVGRGADEGIYAAGVAPTVEASETQVGSELKRLADVGLLVADAPATSGAAGRGRPILPYRRRDSAYWELAEELARQRGLKRSGR